MGYVFVELRVSQNDLRFFKKNTEKGEKIGKINEILRCWRSFGRNIETEEHPGSLFFVAICRILGRREREAQRREGEAEKAISPLQLRDGKSARKKREKDVRDEREKMQ